MPIDPDAVLALSAEDREIGALYLQMPGAPPVPIVDDQPVWDDVMGNEQWAFCAAIFGAAVRAAQAYSR